MVVQVRRAAGSSWNHFEFHVVHLVWIKETERKSTGARATKMKACSLPKQRGHSNEKTTHDNPFHQPNSPTSSAASRASKRRCSGQGRAGAHLQRPRGLPLVPLNRIRLFEVASALSGRGEDDGAGCGRMPLSGPCCGPPRNARMGTRTSSAVHGVRGPKSCPHAAPSPNAQNGPHANGLSFSHTHFFSFFFFRICSCFPVFHVLIFCSWSVLRLQNGQRSVRGVSARP